MVDIIREFVFVDRSIQTSFGFFSHPLSSDIIDKGALFGTAMLSVDRACSTFEPEVTPCPKRGLSSSPPFGFDADGLGPLKSDINFSGFPSLP
jgi:hypothetical protein